MADKEKITWSCAVQVAGGPTMSSSDSMELAGYEKWRLVIGHNKTGVAKVGDIGGVMLVAIVPSKASDKLTYKHAGNDVKLDRAQVLAGEGRRPVHQGRISRSDDRQQDRRRSHGGHPGRARVIDVRGTTRSIEF